MKIALGADHKGFAFKELIKSHLRGMGLEFDDLGTYSEDSADYPDFALKAAQEVASGQADAGVLVCWTGNGMAIAANKVKGIRAALALSPEMAELARAHNNANILVLSGKFTPQDQLNNIIDKFLSTGFEGGRHERRLGKIKKYEDDNIC